MRTFDIQGTYIEGKVELEKPGDFIYYVEPQSKLKKNIAGMVYICPCGCGSMKTIKFRPSERSYTPLWTWDENVEKPSLTPDLQCCLKDGWIGKLIKGTFKGVVE